MTGDEIKKLRTQAGFTQQQLADKVGVTQATVWTWESNTKKASVRHIAQIKAVCNGHNALKDLQRKAEKLKETATNEYTKGYADGYQEAISDIATTSKRI